MPSAKQDKIKSQRTASNAREPREQSKEFSYAVEKTLTKSDHEDQKAKGKRKQEHTSKLIAIINNGGMPFRVKISSDEKSLAVYRSNFGQDVSKDKLWKEFEARRIFVGYCPTEKNATSSEWWHGGNSCIFQLQKTPNRYVHVGCEIFEFQTVEDERIVEYVSTMGNNAVPYPFAVGEKYTYLFIEDVYFPNHDWANLEDRDAYSYYYGLSQEELEKYANNKLPSKRIIHKERLG